VSCSLSRCAKYAANLRTRLRFDTGVRRSSLGLGQPRMACSLAGLEKVTYQPRLRHREGFKKKFATPRIPQDFIPMMGRALEC
jgi:hypothetical protein